VLLLRSHVQLDALTKLVEEFCRAYDGHVNWAQLDRLNRGRELCKGKMEDAK